MSKNLQDDQILEGIPLSISPNYNPPKPVKLPTNYQSLPPQIPPSLYFSYYQNNPMATLEEMNSRSIINDIETWKNEISKIKSEVQNYQEDEEKLYKNWLKESIKKYAPGYFDTSGGILTPKHVRNNSIKNNSSSSSMNELSKVFGTGSD